MTDQLLDVAETVEVATMTAATAMNSALDIALERDHRVVLLGEDIADPIGGVFKVTKGLSDKHGLERVRPTPIAEQAIVGAAVGLAIAGYRPLAEIMFFDFVTVAMDQIVNHAAKLRYMTGGATPAPITVRTTVGGSRFGAQHSQSLEAWFMHTPGIKVVMPSSPREAKGLLAACLEDDDPCLFIDNLSLMYSEKEETPTGHYLIELGKARTVHAGDDLTIVTYGPALQPVLEARELLTQMGIDVEVIDLRTLMPLDLETIFESVGRTRRALVVHDATQFCGPGAEISSQIHEQLFGDLLAPVIRVGGEYVPVPFSKSLNSYPRAKDIVRAALSVTRP